MAHSGGLFHITKRRFLNLFLNHDYKISLAFIMGETCVQVSVFCNLVTHIHWDDSYHLWYNPFKQESMLLDKGKSHHIETRNYRNSVYHKGT